MRWEPFVFQWTQKKHLKNTKSKNSSKDLVSSSLFCPLSEVLMTWHFRNTKQNVTFQLIQLPLFPVCRNWSLWSSTDFLFGDFNGPKGRDTVPGNVWSAELVIWPLIGIQWSPVGQRTNWKEFQLYNENRTFCLGRLEVTLCHDDNAFWRTNRSNDQTENRDTKDSVSSA